MEYDMKAKVNDRFEYNLKYQANNAGPAHHLEILKKDGDCYHIRKDGQVFELELLSYDARSKQARVVIDGYLLEVGLIDELDNLLQFIQQKSAQASGDVEVLAPIPGLIKKTTKKDGDSVEKGASLLILEAMKMENTIQASGTADKIRYHVSEGDHVVKGQKLLTLVVED